MLQGEAATGVLVALYEEAYPAFYAPFLTGPEAPTALAMRLVPADAAERDGGLVLSLRRAARDTAVGKGSLSALLQAGQGELQLVDSRCNWQIRVVE